MRSYNGCLTPQESLAHGHLRLALPRARLPRWLPLLAAFFALYVVWGSTYLVIRIGVAHWPPLLMAGLRFLIAGSLLLGWLRLRGTPWPTARETAAAAVIGILLLGIGNGGVTLAEHWGVTSGIAALSIATVRCSPCCSACSGDSAIPCWNGPASPWVWWG